VGKAGKIVRLHDDRSGAGFDKFGGIPRGGVFVYRVSEEIFDCVRYLSTRDRRYAGRRSLLYRYPEILE
jgi:hypothetical protein